MLNIFIFFFEPVCQIDVLQKFVGMVKNQAAILLGCSVEMARVIFLAATVPMDALKATLKLILEMYPVFGMLP